MSFFCNKKIVLRNGTQLIYPPMSVQTPPFNFAIANIAKHDIIAELISINPRNLKSSSLRKRLEGTICNPLRITESYRLR